MRFRQLLTLTFAISFSLAAWPNPWFGHWPALATAVFSAWLVSPLLGGRTPFGRLLDAGLIISLMTALLALTVVQSARGVLLGVTSTVLLGLSVAARLIWHAQQRRALPATPAELLTQLLAEPPEPSE